MLVYRYERQYRNSVINCSDGLSSYAGFFGLHERAKWLYFFVRYSFGEIIMPFWQMVFYYLIKSAESRSAFLGFDKEVNGFPIINPHRLFINSLILGNFDIFNLVVFTFVARRKFPCFSPFRILNMQLVKYNTVLIFSVIAVVLVIQCAMLVDCQFDTSFERYRVVFGF